MRTLDEVIKAYEQCAKSDWEEGCGDCAYRNEKCGSCKCVRNDDALHYLKEYRQSCADLVENNKRHVQIYHEYREMIDELNRNDPLTWDELKQMEGKPVWVEQYEPIDEKRGWRSCRWLLVEFANDSYWDGRNSDGEQYNFDKGDKTWQAYRKERS